MYKQSNRFLQNKGHMSLFQRSVVLFLKILLFSVTGIVTEIEKDRGHEKDQTETKNQVTLLLIGFGLFTYML